MTSLIWLLACGIEILAAVPDCQEDGTCNAADDADVDEISMLHGFSQFRASSGSSTKASPDKCREKGGHDGDCCAKPSEASCADGYVKVMSGTFCWGDQYEVYMCYPPGAEPASGPDASACLEDEKHDDDCCARPADADCKPGYRLEMSGSYCWKQEYARYACYPDGSQPAEPEPEPATPSAEPSPEPSPEPAGTPTEPVEYQEMTGGQPCQQLCVMEYRGKCQGADVSKGKARLVKDREGCMHYYSWGKDGTLTPCVINRGGKCHKNTNKSWKCWDYTTEEALRAACAAAGAGADVDPWKSFS